MALIIVLFLTLNLSIKSRVAFTCKHYIFVIAAYLQDMERAVNTWCKQNSPPTEWLLSVQLRHLCAYLDVYLETSYPSNFPQSTVFFKDVWYIDKKQLVYFLYLPFTFQCPQSKKTVQVQEIRSRHIYPVLNVVRSNWFKC